MSYRLKWHQRIVAASFLIVRSEWRGQDKLQLRSLSSWCPKWQVSTFREGLVFLITFSVVVHCSRCTLEVQGNTTTLYKYSVQVCHLSPEKMVSKTLLNVTGAVQRLYLDLGRDESHRLSGPFVDVHLPVALLYNHWWETFRSLSSVLFMRSHEYTSFFVTSGSEQGLLGVRLFSIFVRPTPRNTRYFFGLVPINARILNDTF